MDGERINKIIEVLESVRKHTPMYIGRVDVSLTIAWLYGFQTGLLIDAPDNLTDLRDKVLLKRKWKVTNVSASVQMRERGMTPEAIIDELIVIEIEVWKRVAKQLVKQQRLDSEAK